MFTANPNAVSKQKLKRALTLPLLVLYGLGVTIGAGIYVLVEATAEAAGVYAPLSFMLAALVMLPTACAFAELVGRYPLSAGEAAYVRAGFSSQSLSLTIGLLVVIVGTVSAAAISVGSVGYIRQFIDWPPIIFIPLVVIAMVLIATWGGRESVSFAAVMTIIEIGGLILIIGGGMFTPVSPSLAPVFTLTAIPAESIWQIGYGVVGGGVLAFFAFIGFEDLVNMAEETKDPVRMMPRAIFFTLTISTTLYVLVAFIAVLHVPVTELAGSEAPLSLVFVNTTGLSPAVISFIAILATLNGVIVQIIMAARVLYGLSRQGSLPSSLGTIHPVSQTPLVATGLVGFWF